MRQKKSSILFLLFFAVFWGAVSSPPADAGRIIGTDRFVRISEKIKPSVVNITLIRPARQSKNRLQFLVDRFSGKKQRTLMEKWVGSGMIIRQDGLILTNDHVVKDLGILEVSLSDGRKFPATVVGRDYLTDVALIQIEAKNLPVARFGNSDKLRVGEWVLAVGNSLGLHYTVSAGIVSAKGRYISEEGSRSYSNMIQTDAPINLGNSGGPLLNMKGEVIAVNTSTIPGGQSVGFATPINDVKALLPDLIEKGKIQRAAPDPEFHNLKAHPFKPPWFLIGGSLLFSVFLLKVNRTLERKKWELFQKNYERRIKRHAA